jgi:hypothetical protein
MTLCFTPEHLGTWPHYSAPPKDPEDFAEFVTWAVQRYAAPKMRPASIKTAAGAEER